MHKLLTSAILILSFASLFIAYAQSPQASSGITPAVQSESVNLLRTGRKLFVEKCGSCHGERGDKALSTGAPLSERKLPEEKVATAVAGRLKGKTAEQKRAVTLYIMDLMKKE